MYEPTAGPWIGLTCIHSSHSSLIHLNDGKGGGVGGKQFTLFQHYTAGEGEKETCMRIQGYENMSDTCAPNKWWSDGIKDVGELRIWYQGIELRTIEKEKSMLLAAGALYTLGQMPERSFECDREAQAIIYLHTTQMGVHYGLHFLPPC